MSYTKGDCSLMVESGIVGPGVSVRVRSVATSLGEGMCVS